MLYKHQILEHPEEHHHQHQERTREWLKYRLNTGISYEVDFDVGLS